jgi:hypothetical protein
MRQMGVIGTIVGGILYLERMMRRNMTQESNSQMRTTSNATSNRFTVLQLSNTLLCLIT